jgi:uncharacterized membrane protein
VVDRVAVRHLGQAADPRRYNPDTYLPFEVPGVGLVVALMVITLIGALAANLVGRTVLHYWEYFLGRMPVVRSVYSAVKQIFQTAFAKPGSNFQQVGLIEFPRKGAHVVVFVARQLDSGEIGLSPARPCIRCSCRPRRTRPRASCSSCTRKRSSSST